MKRFFFVVSLLVCVNAIAQQAPGAVFDTSKEKWVAQVPGAVKQPPINEELLRAQTAAIKELSAKVEALEARVGKLEKRGH